MMKKWEGKVLRIVIPILVLVMLSYQSEAQKKKKHVQKKSEETTIEDVRQSEYYLSEGEKYYILEDYSKAFVLFQKALEYDNNNATAYYKIGQIYSNNKEYDKALEYSKKAIGLDPKNKYYYLLAAEIYTNQSNFEEAGNIYLEMFENTSNSNEYLFDLAAIYIYQENFEKALKIYDKIEQIYGINEQVVNQKQKLYIRMSKLDEAVAEGEKLIKAFPDEASYYLSLADILISNGKNEQASKYLEKALEIDPKNGKVKLFLANYYRKNGNVERSNSLLKEAFASKEIEIREKIQLLVSFMEKLPNKDLENLCKALGGQLLTVHEGEADAYAINGDLYTKLGEEKKALSYYRKAIENGASNYFIWQNVLRLENITQEYDSVIVHGEDALEYFPNQPVFYYFIGTAHYMKGNWDETISVLEQGKKMALSNQELLVIMNAQLGDAYNSVKNYKKSDECYEEVLSYDPNNDHALNNYSYFLSLRKEKLDVALKMSSKLVKNYPENPTYLDTHAWVLYVDGNYKDALKYIEKAIQFNQDASGTIIEHYGDILYKMGEVDKAVIQWQKAKGLNDTSDLIDKKIADRKLYE